MHDYKKYQDKLDYIKEYSEAKNAASGSKFDANANVENKNVATLSAEMFKKEEIGINRLRMINKITEYMAKTWQRNIFASLILMKFIVMMRHIQ